MKAQSNDHRSFDVGRILAAVNDGDILAARGATPRAYSRREPAALTGLAPLDGEMAQGSGGDLWVSRESSVSPTAPGRAGGRCLEHGRQADADEARLFEAPRPRILLAEDHEETRALLGSMLRRMGYEVTEAATGYDLLDELAGAWLRRSGRLPDLVITDIRMPGPSGLRVLDGIRASTWSLPFIVITAFGDAEAHAEARRLGAAVVLDKPFDLDALRRVVEELLAA